MIHLAGEHLFEIFLCGRKQLLIFHLQDRDRYQFGKTKIFFRAGQVAYLEKLRSDRLRASSVLIQKTVRCWLAKRRYQKMRRSALLVQKFGRGFLARRWLFTVSLLDWIFLFLWLSLTLVIRWTILAVFVYVAISVLTDVEHFKQIKLIMLSNEV